MATTANEVSQAVIRLDGISKQYVTGDSTVQALHPTDLSFNRGESVAIMGQSGSGKSTLLNLLGMLDQPSTGSYTLNGDTVSGLSDDRISDIRCRTIGFIFQSFNLFPSINVLENVCMPMHYARVPRKKMIGQAKALLDRVGLSDRLTHRPSELSGGQCQRVAVARALANDPPVILADEPTGNLDEDTGLEVLNIFRELAADGRLILMVTHNPAYMTEVDRVVTLRDGRVINS
jgi:putative ABC transport system ATP-binding protein